MNDSAIPPARAKLAEYSSSIDATPHAPSPLEQRLVAGSRRAGRGAAMRAVLSCPAFSWGDEGVAAA